MAGEQEKEVIDNLEESNEVVPVKYEITSYGADFPVDGLVRRLQFALYFNGDNYKKSMKEFLNRYIAMNRHLERQSADQLTQVFTNTIGVINDYLGNKAFRPKWALNAAVFDSVMVGVARRLEKGNICDREAFRERYRSLMKNKEFMELTISGTSHEVKVRQRIQMATDAFRDLE